MASRWSRQVFVCYVPSERMGFGEPILDRAGAPGLDIVAGNLEHEVGRCGVTVAGHGALQDLHVPDGVQIEVVLLEEDHRYLVAALVIVGDGVQWQVAVADKVGDKLESLEAVLARGVFVFENGDEALGLSREALPIGAVLCVVCVSAERDVIEVPLEGVLVLLAMAPQAVGPGGGVFQCLDRAVGDAAIGFGLKDLLDLLFGGRCQVVLGYRGDKAVSFVSKCGGGRAEKEEDGEEQECGGP